MRPLLDGVLAPKALTQPPKPSSKIIIVGAGCFYLSIAYALSKDKTKNYDVWRYDKGTIPVSDAASTESIKHLYDACVRKSASFVLGSKAGNFKELTVDYDNVIVGIVPTDDKQPRADQVILATGSWTPSVSDMHGQYMIHFKLSKEDQKRIARFRSREDLLYKRIWAWKHKRFYDRPLLVKKGDDDTRMAALEELRANKD
ncbi:hypothetical protein BD408DRAFT_448616 [Parasitella parasitica]|nr:hypothetical protein BD408DRAFT_448616 [Parasitella parasitica]